MAVIAFVAVLIVHASVVLYKAARAASLWGTPQTLALQSATRAYLANGDWLLGLSYALSAAFMVYAFSRLRAGQKKEGAVAIAGGASIVGLLYFAGCFLLGCCGSPMLVVYLSWFGASFLGFTKPLTLGLTVVSLSVGYAWMERRAKAGCVECACETGTCDEGRAGR